VVVDACSNAVARSDGSRLCVKNPGTIARVHAQLARMVVHHYISCLISTTIPTIAGHVGAQQQRLCAVQ
jgi:hypothetical protein